MMEIYNRVGHKGFIGVVALITLLFLYYFSQTLNQVDQFSIQQDDLSLGIEYGHYRNEFNDQAPKGLDVEDIVTHLNKFEFASLNQVHIGFSKDTHWYWLNLTNLQNKKRDLVLFFDNPMMDYIEVYRIKQKDEKGRSAEKLASLGDKQPGLPQNLIAFPRVKFEIGARSQESILVKAQTTSAALFPISIFEEDGFSRYQDGVYLIWGAFIGVALTMCVYNLILYAGVMDKLYLLYIGYVVSFLFTLGVVHGFLIYLVSPVIFQFTSKYLVTFQFLAIYFALSFGLYFLKYDEQPKRKITKVLKLVCTLFLIGAVASLFIEEQKIAPVFFFAQTVLYVLAFVFIGQKLREKLEWTYFYLFSWTPLFIAATFGSLLATGNIDYNFWVRHALLSGILIEMAFISMALAYRLRTSESKRLFEASHDKFFGLANRSVMESKTKEFSKTSDSSSFSVVLVTISRYETIVPYLTGSDLKQLIYQLVSDIEQLLSAELMLVDIDGRTQYRKTAMIREGVFGFLVTSNDQYLLSNVLNSFSAKQPMSYQASELSINFSCRISAASIEEKDSSTSNLVNRALQAIDIAAEKQRLWWIYSAANKSAEGRKVQLASDLLDAIANNELKLFYQPQLNLADKTVIGCEALLRWNHPKMGYIFPDEFIAIAEDTGLIIPLSQWVFETACGHLKKLRALGFGSHRISLNISVHDVMRDEFHSFVVKILDEYNLLAKHFVLEVTETVSISDDLAFSEKLNELKELGFGMSMDDFGTGYSSLTYVSRHPFDEIKIDREFICNIDKSSKNEAIVRASIEMAKGLGVTVVAEGIETIDSLLMLKSLGCDQGQGYFISKPLSFEMYLDWLDVQNSYLDELLK